MSSSLLNDLKIVRTLPAPSLEADVIKISSTLSLFDVAIALNLSGGNVSPQYSSTEPGISSRNNKPDTSTQSFIVSFFMGTPVVFVMVWQLQHSSGAAPAQLIEVSYER